MLHRSTLRRGLSTYLIYRNSGGIILLFVIFGSIVGALLLLVVLSFLQILGL
jgi:hypothetical protein